MNAPTFSQIAAPVTNLAARTVAVAGAAAALSPVAMAADPAASGLGMGHVAAFAAGAAALKGFQIIRTRFAARPPATMARTSVAPLQVANCRVDSDFEARKQAHNE